MARSLSGRPPDLAAFFSLLSIPSSSHVGPPRGGRAGALCCSRQSRGAKRWYNRSPRKG